jgi:hypothetical protein
MIKTSTDLFDFAKGIKEPPSDPAYIEIIRSELSASIAKLAGCDPESKLTIAKFAAKGSRENSTSRCSSWINRRGRRNCRWKLALKRRSNCDRA